MMLNRRGWMRSFMFQQATRRRDMYRVASYVGICAACGETIEVRKVHFVIEKEDGTRQLAHIDCLVVTGDTKEVTLHPFEQ